jgi:hypothetical protein
VKLGWPERLLIIFSMAWLGYVFLEYQLIGANDCSYTPTDACRAFMHYEPRLTLWRGAAVELLAVALFLWFRKR